MSAHLPGACLKIVLLFVLVTAHSGAKAQKIENIRLNGFADLALTAGNSELAVSASYVQNWKIGKRKKWELGISGRSSSYFGWKKDFITAQARLARTNTTPFLIFFAGQRTETQDTLTVARPFVTAFNLALNAGYHFTSTWSAGFNIDLIGYSFGRKSSAVLRSQGMSLTEPSAHFAKFNLLLTGDHDLGNLNSEFFIRCRISERCSLRVIYQFLFVEYITVHVKQMAPNGELVDRFRNKANLFGIGWSYQLKSFRNL